MSSIFAIGDIHGCLEKLEKMFSLLKIAKNDTVVFLGDYVDRGPQSKEVVGFVIDLKKKHNVVCLLGNHEEMFLNCLDGINENLHLMNGGRATIKSYGGSIPKEHMDFFKSLLPYYETEEYIFVHAGLKPNVPLEEQDLEWLTWIRDEFINSWCDFGKTVVFGHTPLEQPLVEENKIGIDTGAAMGGMLTCIELPSRRILQV
jgi:serine/threonine protein phosphatase 1